MVDKGPLLEREAELGGISAAIERAAQGSGEAILIEGPAGIGKSALLAQAGELASERGVRVFDGRGAELEHELSQGLVRQLFERPLAEAGTMERARLLAGSAALCRSLFAQHDTDPAAPGAEGSFAILHGLYWLAANLAEEAPLMLAVDDLHWSDRPSLRFLEYLARRIDGLSILVCGAYRPTEPLAEPLPLAAIAPTATLLSPAPLSEEGSTALIRTRLSDDADAAFCASAHTASGGNPLLLGELIREVAAAEITPSAAAARAIGELGPRAVRRTVELRLARLGPEVTAVAEAAAVLGDGASLADAASLAGLDPEPAFEAIASLYHVDILRREPRVAFVHPLVRRATYERLDPGARAGAHAKAARVLADRAAAPERIAAHLLLVDPAGNPEVVATLREAARRALAAGGPEDAATYLRRALEEPPADDERAGILLELGQAETLALDPEAIPHLEMAARIAQDSLGRGAALGALGLARYLDADMAAAAATTREALRQLEPGAGGEVEAQLLYSYSLAARAVPELVDELAALLERPRAEPGGETTPAEVVRLIMTGLDAFLRGERRRAIELLDRATEQAAALREATSLPILATVGWFQGHLGQRRDAEANLKRAFEEARRSGSRLHMQVALDGRTYLRWTSGDLAGAIADAETMLRLSDGEWVEATAFARVARCVCLLESGDPKAAASELQLRTEDEARLSGTWWLAWVQYARARLALADGEWLEARRQALAAGERVLAIQAPSPEYIPWRSLAGRAAAQLDERRQALALAREEVELARRSGSPRATGIALAALGEIEGGGRGLECRGEAAEALSHSADRLEHARALVELGTALRHASRPADAREPLHEGIELARACGAKLIEGRAVTELRATGARPRRRARKGSASLTPSERRVAELASTGLTNREIAERVFVTVKTVEVHLTSSYRKLEVDSRDELGSALENGDVRSKLATGR